jgi:lipoyl synthase
MAGGMSVETAASEGVREGTALANNDVSTLERDPFDVRRANFSDEISFFAPGLKRFSTAEFEQKMPRAFLPISLTGSACALKCDHCDTRILDPMIALNQREGLFALCSRLHDTGTQGVLISGGSLRDGTVPLMKHMDDIARVRSDLGMRVLVHTGVVKEPVAVALKEVGVEGVMLDIIGDDATIRDVYHLNLTTADFDQSLAVLSENGHSIRPHIILGLNWGKFSGEYGALEMISRYPVHALVLVILTPLTGTPMQGIDPPSVEEIEAFFGAARRAMPDTLIMLGCARPAGEHKALVDRAAIDCGLNGIAYPAEGIVEYARSRNLSFKFHEHACSCGC